MKHADAHYGMRVRVVDLRTGQTWTGAIVLGGKSPMLNVKRDAGATYRVHCSFVTPL